MFVAEEPTRGLARNRDHVALLGLRLVCLSALVVLLTMHLRSVRVFRWEQSVSGGLTVTYIVAVVGLAMCAGIEECGAKALQAFLCGAGGVLLAVNAITIWRRWQLAGDLTRVVAELLGAMGVPLRRQVLIKAFLSATAAVLMLIDVTWTLVQTHRTHTH